MALINNDNILKYKIQTYNYVQFDYRTWAQIISKIESLRNNKISIIWSKFTKKHDLLHRVRQSSY